MSSSLLELRCEQRSIGWARLRDYIELARPKIAALSLATVAAGAILGATELPAPAVLLQLLGATALLATSASALNQYFERHRDLRMLRTMDRPLPTGRLGAGEVLAFGLASAVLACLWLLTLSASAALVGFATWFIYVGIYTPLKTRTTMNTAIGAVAGALPLAIGWFAVGGAANVEVAALLMIVYLWQFPHFMAIAWLYRDDYAAAGMQMLPVVDPSGERAGWQALLAATSLLAVSAAPCLWWLGGPVYLLGAVALGVMYLMASAQFLRQRDEQRARQLLRTSLYYLPSVLGLLVLAQLW